MQLRYRAICGWLMRAEFSNPVHFHCSLFSYEIYLDSLSTVYTHRLPMVAERLSISRTAPILPERRRSGSVGSTRLDSASRWQAASIEIARNFETFLTRVSYFFFLNLFFKSRNNSRDNSITNIDLLFTPSSFLQKFNYPNENASRDKSVS